MVSKITNYSSLYGETDVQYIVMYTYYFFLLERGLMLNIASNLKTQIVN